MEDLEQLKQILASGNTRLALTLASSFMSIDEVVDFWYSFKRFRFDNLQYVLESFEVIISKDYRVTNVWKNGEVINGVDNISIETIKNQLKQVLILAKIFNNERTT